MRLATQPMRSMLVSRSSFEKPRPFERWVRTTSPSSGSTITPRWFSSGMTMSAMVDLPEPERPVNHSVKPLRLLTKLVAPASGVVSTVAKPVRRLPQRRLVALEVTLGGPAPGELRGAAETPLAQLVGVGRVAEDPAEP